MTAKNTLSTQLLYNQLCFLLNVTIPKIDELEDTTVYRHDVKFHANRLREKIIPLCDDHQRAYINFGNIPHSDGKIDAMDVFNITDSAYIEALDWFFTRPPHHVVSLMTAIRQMEAADPNLLNNIATEYEPIDNDLKIQK